MAVAGGPGGCQQTARQRFLLDQSAGVFHVGSVFALLGGFWLIGAAAGGLGGVTGSRSAAPHWSPWSTRDSSPPRRPPRDGETGRLRPCAGPLGRVGGGLACGRGGGMFGELAYRTGRPVRPSSNANPNRP